MTRPAIQPTTITVNVPFRIVKRGGRKEIIVPSDAPPPRKVDQTLVKALARAFRWKRKLESGEFATLTDLAKSEGITQSYVTRILRLTLLSPDIVDKILDYRQGPEISLDRLLEPFPVAWSSQSFHSH
ncbi:MAG: hypothetical protein ACK4SS_03000 [Cypionkella sp.]